MKLSNSAAQVSTRLKTALTPSCFRALAHFERRANRQCVQSVRRTGRRASAFTKSCFVSESSVRPFKDSVPAHDLGHLLQEPGIDLRSSPESVRRCSRARTRIGYSSGAPDSA